MTRGSFSGGRSGCLSLPQQQPPVPAGAANCTRSRCASAVAHDCGDPAVVRRALVGKRWCSMWKVQTAQSQVHSAPRRCLGRTIMVRACDAVGRGGEAQVVVVGLEQSLKPGDQHTGQHEQRLTLEQYASSPTARRSHEQPCCRRCTGSAGRGTPLGYAMGSTTRSQSPLAGTTSPSARAAAPCQIIGGDAHASSSPSWLMKAWCRRCSSPAVSVVPRTGPRADRPPAALLRANTESWPRRARSTSG